MQPWWTEMLASGRAVSPPACSGPRTFYSAAADGGSNGRRHHEAAARLRDSTDGPATPPPHVAVNQVRGIVATESCRMQTVSAAICVLATPSLPQRCTAVLRAQWLAASSCRGCLCGDDHSNDHTLRSCGHCCVIRVLEIEGRLEPKT